MIEKAPNMKEIFDDYLDRMTEAEILPGRVRYRIIGLADKIYELGGRALTAAVTGAYWDDKDLYSRIASMLKIGMISQELRDTYYGNHDGLGGSYWSGGADSVYTQMLTEKNIQDKLKLEKLYHSKARMLISLDALELGSYQYYSDSFGTRIYDTEDFWWWNEGDYKTRPNTLEFTETLQKSDSASWNWEHQRHEVMLKERIDPSFFKGIIVDNEKTKTELIDYLRTHDLIQKNSSGEESILNIALDSFFRVGQRVTEDLIR